MCRCASLHPAEEAVPTRDAFIRTFELLESSVAQWAELLRCRDCGQLWKVELGAEVDRRPNIAFQVQSADGWLKLDERPLRAALLTRLLGGNSDAKCMQAGCTAPALKQKAFCALHLGLGSRL